MSSHNKKITLSIGFLKGGEVLPIQCHTNASLLLYCEQGQMKVSFILPVVGELKTFMISSNQVVNIPQGAWYLIQAKRDSQWLNTLDQSQPQTLFASDLQQLKEVAMLASNLSSSPRQYVRPAIEIQSYYSHHGNLSFPKDEALRE